MRETTDSSCPRCGVWIKEELWETESDECEIECPHCDAKLNMTRQVFHTYILRSKEL